MVKTSIYPANWAGGEVRVRWVIGIEIHAAQCPLVVAPYWLLHFEPGVTNHKQTGILYEITDYLELLDWTGRTIRDDKRGSTDAGLPPILTRLGISAKQWRINTTHFEVIHDRRFNRSPNIDTG